jgi:hypothetical protein
MSFFSSGAVDTNVINRDKLPEGVYVIALTDFADYYGATNGDRTQVNFTVEQGASPSAPRLSYCHAQG